MAEQTQENTALQLLVGQKVVLQSTLGDEGFSDKGTLEAYDYPWVRLRKENGEVLCFAVSHIRLIKAA